MAAVFDPDAILRGPIEDDVLREVYASDQDMYPAPLTFERLKSWVDACPDLSINFRSGASQPIGVAIALPIRRPYWDDLLKGNLKETDIDPEIAFPSRKGVTDPEDVGLHVFHIERFAGAGSTKRGGFAELVVHEIVQRALLRKEWKLVGLSALTATPAGNKTFKRLGFSPTGYTETFIVEEADGVDDKERVRMVSTYAGETQPPLETGHPQQIISQSEMKVKYL
ncbi:hypothetical protein QBC34DRAFT_391576 [Podospora aff. communis PSN243]|uniref:N-acetyltransferase domain-containing protein n=1 Tax=Podospora aff. communis PSN243 TaxID=3040156 RepID=A0AAV9H322_9PEZI|nr:hypothetical protein QBC34DRAFT_391576 [Podospora aff. communis PSN243]